MEKRLKEYGRFLLLQAQLPGLEKEKEDTRRHCLAMERERSQRKVEWEYRKTPGFFQRLMGGVEEKKDVAYRAYQEADAAWKEAVHLSQMADSTYQKVKEEYDSLTGTEEPYASLDKTQEVRALAMDTFRPAALQRLSNVLVPLEQAMQWEIQERGMGVHSQHGSLEYLAQAREEAKALKYILAQFPEPETWMCPYLEDPDSFIHDGVIMKVSPRDKVRAAVGQIQRLKEKLNG